MSLSEPQFQAEFDSPHDVPLFPNGDFRPLYPQDIVELAESVRLRLELDAPLNFETCANKLAVSFTNTPWLLVNPTKVKLTHNSQMLSTQTRTKTVA